MKLRIILCLVVMTATSLVAQTFRGTILGTVTDPSGAVVAGAQVSAKNTGTGQERVTTTSADGSYTIPELPIGTYTVTITQSGFQTFIATGVTVDVASQRRVDGRFEVPECHRLTGHRGAGREDLRRRGGRVGGVQQEHRGRRRRQ